MDRFKYYSHSQIIEDKKTDKRYYGNQAITYLLNELNEENKKLKTYTLPILPYMYYFDDKKSYGVYHENIYHRTSRQLEEYLIEKGFLIDKVSRCSIGRKSYYHVEINLKESDWSYEKTNDLHIAKILDIDDVGLVDFFEHEGYFHEIILIDERKLNDKYLKNGNLVFE